MPSPLNIRDLGQERRAALEREARATGKSVAEVVRDWIDVGIARSRAERDRAEWTEAAKDGIADEGCYLERNGPALSERKPEIDDDLRDAKGRLEALTGELSAVQRKYDALKEDARTARDADLEAQAVRAEEAQNRHAEDMAAAANRRDQARVRVADAHKGPMQAAEDRLQSAHEAVGAAKQRATAPEVSPKILQRRDEANEALLKLHDERSASERTERQIQKDVNKAKAECDKISAEISQLEVQRQELGNYQRQLEASKKPKPGSLLAFLRETRENWGDNIARVINPDLLHRDDLSPGQASTADNLYGIALDLSAVEPADAADLSEIEGAIEETEATIAEVEQDISEATRRRSRADETHVQARRSLSNHQAQHTVLVQRIKATQATLEARNSDVRKAQQNAEEIAKQRLVSAQNDLKHARDARHAAQKALENATAEVDRQGADEVAAIDRQLQEALEKVRARKDEAKSRFQDRISELERELNATLADKGVDTATMYELQRRIDAAQRSLLQIRQNEEVVNGWRHFLKTVKPKIPDLKLQLGEASRNYHAKVAEVQKLKDEWGIERKDFSEKLHASRARLRELAQQLEHLGKRLAAVESSEISPASKVVRTLAEITASLNETEKRIRELEADIRQGVTRISKVFLEVPGSPAAQHLTSRRASFASTVEGPEWVPALIEWFDSLHQQHRDNLMNDGRILANNIVNAYERMISLDKEIQRENRKLQASLNANNVASVVQDLSVSITSTIRKLDFMPAMERMSKRFEQWRKSGSVEPPEGFTEAMTSLLSFWHGREGITANLRDEIRIEGYIVENGNRRDFHARTDLTDISSNGVSYLVLTTILVGFVNMVRGKSPVHVVWALDELGNIDAGNTRRLLQMLKANHITLIAATPSAAAAVNRLFDYRLKIVEGPRLADVKGAGRGSNRLLSSPDAPHPGDMPTQGASYGGATSMEEV